MRQGKAWSAMDPQARDSFSRAKKGPAVVLDDRLRDLQDRVHRGSYHPQPVRRVYIPKGDGRTRPLGIPSVIRGHINYYGVPSNSRALVTFRRDVRNAWYRQLRRRSQRARWTVEKTKRFDVCYPLPPPRIVHPWPWQRFAGP
jgi:hypothetical protein